MQSIKLSGSIGGNHLGQTVGRTVVTTVGSVESSLRKVFSKWVGWRKYVYCGKSMLVGCFACVKEWLGAVVCLRLDGCFCVCEMVGGWFGVF